MRKARTKLLPSSPTAGEKLGEIKRELSLQLVLWCGRLSFVQCPGSRIDVGSFYSPVSVRNAIQRKSLVVRHARVQPTTKVNDQAKSVLGRVGQWGAAVASNLGVAMQIPTLPGYNRHKQNLNLNLNLDQPVS